MLIGKNIGRISYFISAKWPRVIKVDILASLPIILIIFAWGSAIGSFLNVVVYRLPAGLSILWPPSRCPRCLHRLSLSENLPVVGWLRLKGRCQNCRQPIALRYPLVEALTGFLFLLVFAHFGPSLASIGYCLFFSWLLALTLIDIDTMTLPNSLTQSGLVAGLIFQISMALTATGISSQVIAGLMLGVFGAVVGLWVFDLFLIIGSIAFGQTAMGGGDPKLAAMIGAWLGWQLVLVAGFIACFFGALVGSSAIALGWLDRRQPMPFGPFLALGAAIATLWGKPIIATYLHWFFPLQ